MAKAKKPAAKKADSQSDKMRALYEKLHGEGSKSANPVAGGPPKGPGKGGAYGGKPQSQVRGANTPRRTQGKGG